jgi:hypothetical protein
VRRGTPVRYVSECMGSTLVHWYAVTVIVMAAAGLFTWFVARDEKKSWLLSGWTLAQYEERLRRNRRQALLALPVLAAIYACARLLPAHLSAYLAFAPTVVFLPWALYEIRRDRAEMVRSGKAPVEWWRSALWYVVLVIALYAITAVVVPPLLDLA